MPPVDMSQPPPGYIPAGTFMPSMPPPAHAPAPAPMAVPPPGHDFQQPPPLPDDIQKKSPREEGEHSDNDSEELKEK